MNQKSRLLVLDYPFVLALKKIETNLFSLIGGNIEPNESPLQSLIREAKEEANINLKETSVQFFKRLSYQKGETKHVRNYFQLLDLNYKFKVNEIEKFQSIEWVDFLEHEKQFKKADRKVIKSIFEAEFQL